MIELNVCSINKNGLSKYKLKKNLYSQCVEEISKITNENNLIKFMEENNIYMTKTKKGIEKYGLKIKNQNDLKYSYVFGFNKLLDVLACKAFFDNFEDINKILNFQEFPLLMYKSMKPKTLTKHLPGKKGGPRNLIKTTMDDNMVRAAFIDPSNNMEFVTYDVPVGKNCIKRCKNSCISIIKKYETFLKL